MSNESSQLSVRVHLPSEDLDQFLCSYVSIPGYSGQLGIKPNHTFYSGMITPGVVTIHPPINSSSSFDTPSYYFVSGGFFQVKDNALVLLVESWLSWDQVDFDSAKQIKENALKMLAKTSDISVDINQALKNLKIAEAKLYMKSLVKESNPHNILSKQGVGY